MDSTNKLPVFRTFGNALGFAFGNYFTVLRLAWLPFTLLLAAQLGLGYVVGISVGERFINPMGAFDHIGDLFFLQIVMWILQLLVIAAIAVSIHRIILFGDRRPGVFFSFRFGRTEFIYAVMAVMWALMVVAIIAALVAPVIFLISGGDLPGLFARVQAWMKDWPKHAGEMGAHAGPLLGVWAAYMIGWIIVLYVSLRLCVWPPAIVATNRLSPAEPWRLTRGNAGRLFGLFVLAILALYVVIGAIAGVFFYEMRDELAGWTPPAVPKGNNPVALREHFAHQFDALMPYWPALWLGLLLIYSFVIAMTVALISYSYKALKGYDAKEPIPDAA